MIAEAHGAILHHRQVFFPRCWYSEKDKEEKEKTVFKSLKRSYVMPCIKFKKTACPNYSSIKVSNMLTEMIVAISMLRTLVLLFLVAASRIDKYSSPSLMGRKMPDLIIAVSGAGCSSDSARRGRWVSFSAAAALQRSWNLGKGQTSHCRLQSGRLLWWCWVEFADLKWYLNTPSVEMSG